MNKLNTFNARPPFWVDPMGRIVMTKFMHEGQSTAAIDLDQVISGVYFVNTIENGKDIYTTTDDYQVADTIKAWA